MLTFLKNSKGKKFNTVINTIRIMGGLGAKGIEPSQRNKSAQDG